MIHPATPTPGAVKPAHTLPQQIAVPTLQGREREQRDRLRPLAGGPSPNRESVERFVSERTEQVRREIGIVKEYPKIETLFERDLATHKVNPDKLRMPVVRTISKWLVTEKIDGTNIRISLTTGPDRKVVLGGRTDNASLPADLVRYLVEYFTVERMKKLLTEDNPEIGITLYGEGYGPGIQKGGGDYGHDKRFILFDAAVWQPSLEAGFWWQDDATVTEFAKTLDIPRVPILGFWTLEEIVEAIRPGLPSRTARNNPERNMEGIVARPLEPLFDRRGKRLIIKLKTKDF